MEEKKQENVKIKVRVIEKENLEMNDQKKLNMIKEKDILTKDIIKMKEKM